MKEMKSELQSFYQHVCEAGNLRSEEHARRWSSGVLKSLGTTLPGSTKRALAKALPTDLARELKGVFWLLHFRDRNLSEYEFRNRVARRSGNSDPEFALRPTLAVFGGIQRFVDAQLNRRVARDLAPEVAELWNSVHVSDQSA